jgi:hypothetical protein
MPFLTRLARHILILLLLRHHPILPKGRKVLLLKALQMRHLTCTHPHMVVTCHHHLHTIIHTTLLYLPTLHDMLRRLKLEVRQLLLLPGQPVAEFLGHH